MNKKKLFLAIVGFFIFSLSGNCAVKEKVTLQLRWDHQFQFAGYYAAKWEGYYQDAGFDVEIRSALETKTKILNAVKEVAEGRADFGIGATDVLLARNKGIPLVILATIFQKSAAGFFVKESTKFDTLIDLLKLKVARQVDSLIDLEFQAMLYSEGIDPKLVKAYPHHGGIDHLESNEIDVMPGYTISSPYAFKNHHIKFKTLTPWRYGIDFYGDSLFTHKRLINKDPDLIERFTEATLKGWKYALNNSDEIAKQIAKELPRKAVSLDLLEFNRFQVKGVRELTLFPIVTVGHTNPDRWKRMNEYLRQLGIINGELDINEFVYNPEQRRMESVEKYQKIVFLTGSSLLLIAIMVFVWTFLLRRTVGIKTAELSEEIIERKATEALLKKSEMQIKTSLKEKETLLQEIHHRVKNNMQIIASLLKLQASRQDDPGFQSILRENIGRVYSMSAIHENLYQSEKLSEINLKSYILQLSQILLQTYSFQAARISYQIEIPDIKLNIEKANPLGLVLNELISNSLKYAFPDDREGIIGIKSTLQDNNNILLIFNDDGVGMPDEVNWENPETLGLRLVKDLVEKQLNGSIKKENQTGAQFTIEFNLDSAYRDE